jgi:multiple sugar transport system permease protein
MFQSAWQTEWTHLMAASAIVTVPIIVLYIFVQKNFVEGIATTGIKG